MNKSKISAFLLVGVMLLGACSPKPEPAAGDSSSAKPMNLPYTPSYSSSFEMGNPDYAAMVVQGGWKDWEDNNLDNLRNWMSDTIVVYQANNKVIKGIDNVISAWKADRAKLTSSKVTLNAVMPVYSTDKKENWVLIWATEIDAGADGAVDTASYMETWRINSAGKADLLFSHNRANRK